MSSLDHFNAKQKALFEEFIRDMREEWKSRNLGGYLEYIQEPHKTRLVSKIKCSRTILDIGCGFGYALPRMLADAQEGATVVGVDIDRKAIDDAASRIMQETESKALGYHILTIDEGHGIPDKALRSAKGQSSKRIILYNTGAELMLKCRENTFDLVLALHVFRYVPDKMSALLRTLAVLKKGAAAYLFSDLADVLMLEEEPDLLLLSEMQQTILNDKDCEFEDLLRRCLADTPHQNFGEYKLLDRYLKGIKIEKLDHGKAAGGMLKITKLKDVSRREPLPDYCSFLVCKNDDYKTVSVYTENK